MKKLINRVEDVLTEQLAGLAKAYPSLALHQESGICHPRRCAGDGQSGAAFRRWQRTRAYALRLYWSGHALWCCPGEIFTSPTPDKMFECAMQIDAAKAYC